MTPLRPRGCAVKRSAWPLTTSRRRCGSPPKKSCRASSAPRMRCAACSRDSTGGSSRPGRTFYPVAPRSLPPALSYEAGGRLADDLLARHLEEDGRHPETVGIVVWGTAAMRTHGDDIGEILALLGVRPTWNPETRRITG